MKSFACALAPQDEVATKLEDIYAEAARAGISGIESLEAALEKWLQEQASKSGAARPENVQYVAQLLVLQACEPASSGVGMLALGSRASKSAAAAAEAARKQIGTLEASLGIAPLDRWTEDHPEFKAAHVQFLALEVKAAQADVQGAVQRALSLTVQERSGAGGGDALKLDKKASVNKAMCVLNCVNAAATCVCA